MKNLKCLWLLLLIVASIVPKHEAVAESFVMPSHSTTFGSLGGGIAGIGGAGFYRPISSIGISVSINPAFTGYYPMGGCGMVGRCGTGGFGYGGYGYGNAGYGYGSFGNYGYGYPSYGFGSHGGMFMPGLGYGYGYGRPIAMNCGRCHRHHTGGCRRRGFRSFAFSFGFGGGGFGFGFNSVRF